MKIKGIHHVELTVKDLQVSKQFYSNIPTFKVVAEYPDFVMLFNGSLYIGLTTHKTVKKKCDRFSEFNIGLDHFALEVDSLKSLQEMEQWLHSQGIAKSKIETLTNGTKIIVFRDPDNIQIEFAFRGR